jgi:transposase
MVFFTIAKNKGKEYLCLEDRARINGKVVRTFFKYIGPREKFPNIPLGKVPAGINPLDAVSFDTIVFEFGISAALWSLANELELPRIIDSILQERQAPNLTTGEYLTLAAINRIAEPCSKTSLSAWFRRSWLSTRIPLDPDILNAQTYWNVFQRINGAQMEEIEIALGNRVRDRFGLQWDQLLYDTTNFFSYSKVDKPDGFRHTGHAKQQRANLPLVNFFLLCAKPWGIPLFHEPYAGNTQDAKEFKLIPDKVAVHLEKMGYTPDKITLFFDKGNLSPKAFQSLDAQHLHFIASLRNSMVKDLLHVPRGDFIKIILPQTKKTVEYFRLKRNLYEQEREVIVVIDPANETKHRHDFALAFQKKQGVINAFITDQLNIKKWRDQKNVEIKFKKLIGKSPWKEILQVNLSGTYGQLTAVLTVNQTAKESFQETFGRSILFTNQTTWSAEEIIWSYREQYLIEHAFRILKNPAIIAIRPMYVSSEKSIEGHIFVCILALFLLSILRLKLAKKGVYLNYEQIRDTLVNLHINKIIPRSGQDSFFKLETIPNHTIKVVKLLHLEQLI